MLVTVHLLVELWDSEWIIGGLVVQLGIGFCSNQLIVVDVCICSNREQGSVVLLLLFVRKRDEWRQEEEGAFEQNLCAQTGQSSI